MAIAPKYQKAEKESDRKAAQIFTCLAKIDTLINAFKFVIQTSDASHMTEKDFEDIEKIIAPSRQAIFWIKFQPNADQLRADNTTRAPKGFLKNHITDLSLKNEKFKGLPLKYKSEEYEDHLAILSHWVDNMAIRLHHHYALDTSVARQALRTIQIHLWDDGGLHSLNTMKVDDKGDKSFVRGRLVHAKAHHPERRREISDDNITAYIRRNNANVEQALAKLRNFPENVGKKMEDKDLMNDYNENTINRRKDLLDVLANQIGNYVKIIEKMHRLPQSGRQAGAGR